MGTIETVSLIAVGDEASGLTSNSAAQAPVPFVERGSVNASDSDCETNQVNLSHLVDTPPCRESVNLCSLRALTCLTQMVGIMAHVKKAIAAFGAVALVSIGVLSGCSSDDAAPVEEPAVEEPAVEEPAPVAQAESLAPGNSVAWAPGQDAVTILVGQFIDITVGDPLATTVSSSDPSTLKPFPGKQDEDKVFYPAAKGINPGAATLTVTLPDGTSSDIAVTVNGR